jgi:hypothetical protein
LGFKVLPIIHFTLNNWYFIFKLIGKLLFKLQKIGFMGLNQNMRFIQCRNLMLVGTPADRGNRLAAVEAMAEISLQMQLKRTSSRMPISAIR